MTIPFTSQVVATPDVLVNEVGGEAVLLDLKSERYFGLDGIGTRMWTLLTQSSSIQTAYEALLEEYEVTPEQLQQDLDTLIAGLAEQGLVEVRDA